MPCFAYHLLGGAHLLAFCQGLATTAMAQDPADTGGTAHSRLVIAEPLLPSTHAPAPVQRSHIQIIQVQPSDVPTLQRRRQLLAASRLDISSGTSNASRRRSSAAASGGISKSTVSRRRHISSPVVSAFRSATEFTGLRGSLRVTGTSELTPQISDAQVEDVSAPAVPQHSLMDLRDGLESLDAAQHLDLGVHLDFGYPPDLPLQGDDPYWTALISEPAARFRLDETLFVIQHWDEHEEMLQVRLSLSLHTKSVTDIDYIARFIRPPLSATGPWRQFRHCLYMLAMEDKIHLPPLICHASASDGHARAYRPRQESPPSRYLPLLHYLSRPIYLLLRR